MSIASNPDFIALIESSRERYPAGTGIPLEVARRLLGVGHSPRAKKAQRSSRSAAAKQRARR